MKILKDLILKHSIEIKTSPEKIWEYFSNLEQNYTSWHPKDHISFKWLVPPDNGHIGTVQQVIETVKFPTLLRIRWEDIKSIPISAEYRSVLAASVLNRNDIPIAWLLHEYESIQNGTRLRTTFRLPVKSPPWFIKALRKHNIGEISEFQNFLPKLYEENT